MKRAHVLDRLLGCGPTVRLRKQERPEEVDLALASFDLPRVEREALGAGMRMLAAPGHGRHRFFVGHADGRWVKVDAVVEDAPAGGRWQRIRRRLPSGLRRTGPVVALVGPDGAGKGTVVDGLRERIPIGVTVVYLGRRRGAGKSSRRPSLAREVAFLLRRAAGMHTRLLQAYLAAWRGHIVLCDRHPWEVLATRPRRTATGARLERLLLYRLVPRPDVFVVCDAPAEVLAARKAEHDEATLRRMRDGYLRAFACRGHVVSTEGSVGETLDRASQAVWEALCARRRW